MRRIDPGLITFLHDAADFKTVWDKAVDRLTPYFAINRGTALAPRWYLLTARDLARCLTLGNVRLTGRRIRGPEQRPDPVGIDPAGIVIGDVIKFGKALAVNKTGRPSVRFDKRGNPKGIDVAEPFADLLTVHGITVPPPGPAAPESRRRGGAASTRPVPPRKAAPTVTRIPHMDLEPGTGAIAVGATMTVTVFANTAPRTEDEDSKPLQLDAAEGAVNLEVRLETSAHLKVVGKAVQPLTVDPGKESTRDLTFKVKAVEPAAAGAPARITAYFSRTKRPCGYVRRTVEIAAPRAQAKRSATPPPRSPETGRLDVRTAIDSDVLVVVRNPSGDQMNFRVEVHTNLLDPREYAAGPVDWGFPRLTSKIVYGMFKQFEQEGQSNAKRYARLNGAGVELWQKAPRNFVDLFWTLIDRKKPIKTIAIVSEEPYIPWELMGPFRYVDSKPVYRPLPLGVEFTVARWTANDMISAPQSLPLSESRVVAPRYKHDPLAHADDEVKMVLTRVPGERIDPADFAGLSDHLSTAQATLLHFACHGVDSPKDDDGDRLVSVQAVRLEGSNETLDSREVKGLPSFRTFFGQRPLVVLNACEVGRPAPALNGIGGLANSFIDLGASGVIAPLWSVDDQVAFKVATALYQALAARPAPTFAEVMRSIRARAYVGDEMGTDSYAAYCFYGDPLARPG
jgi:hypothetical protein